MASVKDLTPFGIRLETCRRIPIEDFEKLVRQGCQPVKGDVLIAKDGATALDTVCEVKRNEDVVLLSSVAILRPNPTIIDSSYLHYYLDASTTRSYLKGTFVSGAAIPRVVLKDLKRAVVRVPPLPIQRRIAGILSAYDELIENSQRRIKILESMARALYREWFVHFRFPGHDNPAGQPDWTAEGRPAGASATDGASQSVPRVPSPLGEIPKGWEVASLEKLHPTEGAVVLTGPFGSKLHASDYRAAGVPLLLVKHVRDGQVNEEDLPLVGEHKTPELDRYRLKTGDIVMTRVGYVGDSAFIFPRYDGWLFSGQTLRIRLPKTSRLNSRFLAQYLLLQAKPRIEKIAVGATRASLNTDLVASLDILVPPLVLQRRFAEAIQPVDSLKVSLREKVRNLRRTRDLLLPRLLSGQIDVETIVS